MADSRCASMSCSCCSQTNVRSSECLEVALSAACSLSARSAARRSALWSDSSNSCTLLDRRSTELLMCSCVRSNSARITPSLSWCSSRWRASSVALILASLAASMLHISCASIVTHARRQAAMACAAESRLLAPVAASNLYTADIARPSRSSSCCSCNIRCASSPFERA
eukprot:scaffold315325_cov26-Tisochrysis_lutea.AAC.2